MEAMFYVFPFSLKREDVHIILIQFREYRRLYIEDSSFPSPRSNNKQWTQLWQRHGGHPGLSSVLISPEAHLPPWPEPPPQPLLTERGPRPGRPFLHVECQLCSFHLIACVRHHWSKRRGNWSLSDSRVAGLVFIK